MTEILCSECKRPLGGNMALCRYCVDELAEQLLKLPALLHELTITRCGLGRNGPPTLGSASAEPPLPIRVTGRDRLPGEAVVQRLETAVIGWARVIGEDLGVIPAVNIAYLVQMTQDRRQALHATQRTDLAALADPATPLEQAAVWLAHHRREIARHEAAPELARDIRGAIGALAAVIWPAARQYLGLCTNVSEAGEMCGHELHAERDAAYTKCRRCRTQYEVAALRDEVLRTVEDRLYRVADLVRVLSEFGHRVPRSTVYWWAREYLEPRGWQHSDAHGIRITDHQISPRDHRVYRLGDAIALARRDQHEGGSAA